MTTSTLVHPLHLDDEAPPATWPESVGYDRPWGVRIALAGILAVALGLRLWGIKQGLPFAYNADENAHFLPYAIGMFSYGFDPRHYFANPPALTYLLHFVFAAWFDGRAGVSDALALHPTQVFVVARVTVAVLGTISVWLLYMAGERLFDRGVGLLAAAIMAVAYLPVFYSHLALNDVPALAPLTMSLVGTAGVLRRGKMIDYAIAGIGLGLGCATKYTAGIVVVPLIAAICCQFLERGGQRRALAGMLLALVCAVAFFLIANPYSLLDWKSFKNGIVHQSTVSEDASGKLGAPRNGGLLYYLWTFTWGLGWAPSLTAIGGAVLLWWRDRRLLLLFVPTILLFLVFMGTQGRYFGRWLLPIFPLVCLLSAFCILDLARRAGASRRFIAVIVGVIGTFVVLVQGAIYSAHSGLVLSRADTRNLTREWMAAHIPVGAHVVVEPLVPDTWVQDPGMPTSLTSNGNHWIKYIALRSVIDAKGDVDASHPHSVSLENYEQTLSPQLINHYQDSDPAYCWVVTGYAQEGRALADPKQVPLAIAYYKALARRAKVAYSVSPYSPGKGPVAFNFDWTFDYYPLAYERPGPQMTVYHLTGGNCAPAGAANRARARGASGAAARARAGGGGRAGAGHAARGRPGAGTGAGAGAAGARRSPAGSGGTAGATGLAG